MSGRSVTIWFSTVEAGACSLEGFLRVHAGSSLENRLLLALQCFKSKLTASYLSTVSPVHIATGLDVPPMLI